MGRESEKVRRSLTRHGFVMVRRRKHEIWEDDSGRRVILPRNEFGSPRSRNNILAQLSKIGIEP